MDDKKENRFDQLMIRGRDKHLFGWLSLLFLLPAAGYLQIYMGLLAGGILFFVGLGLIWLLVRYQSFDLSSYLVEPQITYFLWFFLGASILLFAFLYPQLDWGSDRDDAINIGTRYLLNGRFPYEGRTQLGNPFSNLPGSFILALPFVLLGSSAYQNIFWLVAVYLVLRFFDYGKKEIVFVVLLLTFLSIPFWHEFLTGGDLLSSNIFLGSFLLLYWWCDGKLKGVSGLLLGIGLATRPHFWIIIPLIWAGVMRKVGWRTAVGEAIFPFFITVLLCGSFYLWSPAQFSPIHNASGEMAQFNQIVPFFEWFVYVGMLLLSLLGSWKQDGEAGSLFFWYGVVQLFPLLSISLLGTAYNGQIDLRYLALFSLNYTIPFLFFLIIEGGRKDVSSDGIEDAFLTHYLA